MYADKEIILLDDVLSAVDARVGKHIMNNCILDLFKTRILATHQLSLIGSADRVIFLNPNGTIDVGKFEELQATNESFSKLMAYNSESKKEDETKTMMNHKMELNKKKIQWKMNLKKKKMIQTNHSKNSTRR